MKHYVERVTKSTKLRFLAVGGVNTAVDFALLNLLAHGLELPRLLANAISVSVAMSISFMANRSFIFEARDGNTRRQVTWFVAVTAVGLYGIQTGVIWICSDVWPAPLERLHDAVGLLEREVFLTNAAKVIATTCTMLWNYTLYKRLVFVDEEAST